MAFSMHSKDNDIMSFFAGHIASSLKPNVVSLGYALFLAINAAGVWGGVFPFLPMDFQTPRIVMVFFVAQSLTFFAAYVASAAGAYRLPQLTHVFIVRLAVIPYLLGWVCLIGALYMETASPEPLVLVGGALLGLGSAGFYMMWQRLFASQEASTGNLNLIQGTAWGAVLYFGLHLIPGAVTAFLIPVLFLPLFGLCIWVQSRGIDSAQPMFEDKPFEHPAVYKQAVREYWRSAVSVAGLGLCTGVMRALAIGAPQVGSLVNIMSMAGALVGASVLLYLWKRRNVSMNIPALYRITFPFLLTSLLIMPFAPEEYLKWLAAVTYAVYSVALMLSMMQSAQASRDQGLNPVFIYGLFGSVIYGFHDLGFISVTLLGNTSIMGIPRLAVVALATGYVLGVMFFLGTGGFKLKGLAAHAADSVELVAPRGNAAKLAPSIASNSAPPSKASTSTDTCTGSRGNAPGAEEAARQPGSTTHSPQAERPDFNDQRAFKDAISKKVALLQQEYGLSTREAEVAEYVAHGYTAVRIAEMLYVSDNTVRTHVKRVYAKLGIHRKGELLDMIDHAGEPAAGKREEASLA